MSPFIPIRRHRPFAVTCSGLRTDSSDGRVARSPGAPPRSYNPCLTCNSYQFGDHRIRTVTCPVGECTMPFVHLLD
jgi:hypothetical protein